MTALEARTFVTSPQELRSCEKILRYGMNFSLAAFFVTSM
jgi:hypothetical protein